MTTFVLSFEGHADGSDVTIRLIAAGMAHDVGVPTTAGEPGRAVAERVRDAARRAGRDVPIAGVEHVGQLLAIRGLDDAQPLRAAGLHVLATAYEQPVALPSAAGGSAPRAPAPPADDAPSRDPDAEVLDHLERYLGSLAEGSAARAKLMRMTLTAQRAFSHGTMAYLTGTPIPPEPNPGLGGEIVTDPASTEALLKGLADTSAKVADGLARGEGAAAEQVSAATGKEAEAKKGNSGGGGNGGTGQPKPQPAAGGGGGGATGGGDKPAGPAGAPGTGDKPGGAGDVLVKPKGSPNTQAEVHTPACEILIYVVNGMEYRLGRVQDGTPGGRWYLSSGADATEVSTLDGKHTTVVDGYEHFDAPVDKEAFDRWFEEQRQAAAKAPATQDDGWSAAEIASFVLSSLPVIGEVKTLAEALLGYDLVTLEELDYETRVLYAVAAVAFSPVGAGMFKQLSKAGREALGAVKSAFRTGDAAATKAAVKGLDRAATERAIEEAEELAASARRKTRAKRIEVEVRECGRAPETIEGAVRPETYCFAAGTPVRAADGSMTAIERVEPAHEVAAAPAARTPVLAPLGRGRVLRTFRREAAGVLELALDSGDGRHERLVTTAAHLIGTPDGYRPAATLRPGAAVLALGGPVRVAAVDQLAGPRTVYNLEVEEAHSYFVGRLGVLVHNRCEAASQRGLERMIDAPGSTLERIHPGSEPGFANGEFVRRTRAEVNAGIKEAKAAVTQARKAGMSAVEVEQLEDQVRRLTRERASMTFPDGFVREGNRTLALEIKTLDESEDIFSRFQTESGGRKVARENAVVIQEQIVTRGKALPPGAEQVLVIDARPHYKDLYGLTGPALERRLQQLFDEEVRHTLTTGSWSGMEEVTGKLAEVRFMVGPNDTPLLSRPFSLKGP